MVLALNCGPDLGIADQQASPIGETRGDVEEPNIPAAMSPQHGNYGEIFQDLGEQFMGNCGDVEVGSVEYFDTNADCKRCQPAEQVGPVPFDLQDWPLVGVEFISVAQLGSARLKETDCDPGQDKN